MRPSGKAELAYLQDGSPHSPLGYHPSADPNAAFGRRLRRSAALH
jgi:hypothetical protein